MTDLGTRPRALPLIDEERTVAPGTVIASLERGECSSTWSLEERVRHRSAVETRNWVAARYGSIDEPQTSTIQINWRAYDVPE